MKLPRLLAAAAAFALPVVAHAQAHIGAVSGFVVDSAGKPITSASITVVGTPVVATTGAQGDYRLDSVPAGPHQIRFQKGGFADLTVATTIKENDVSDLDVMLKAPSSKAKKPEE